jgi:hypothetical protein
MIFSRPVVGTNVPALLPAVAGLAGAAGGLQLYVHFAGEHPLLDPIYERALRGCELPDLARAAAARPASDVVVTLTTLPSRIERIGPTVKSLLRQTTPAAEIRLHVPSFSRREGRTYDVPQWLQNLDRVRIVRCEDFGPATKIIPALLAAAPSTRLVAVDDDRIYHPWLIEQLAAASDAHAGTAVAASGWDAPPDLIDRPTRLRDTLLGRAPAPIKCTRVRGRRDVDVMQGFSGYLVRPSFFDLDAVVDYRGAPAAAFFVDDVWISAHCRVAKAVIGGRRTNFESRRDARFFKRSSVALVNRGDGTPLSRNNTIMLRYFAGRWRNGGSG